MFLFYVKHIPLQNASPSIARNLVKVEESKEEFFAQFYPGLESDSNVMDLVELLTSKNPDLLIKSWTLTRTSVPVSIMEFKNVSTIFAKDQKLVDYALNPKLFASFNNMTTGNISGYKTLFAKLQKQNAMAGLMPVLWYSR